MIDKRSKIGKMIDKNKIVYECIKCNRKFIGTIETDINKCPSCKWEGFVVIVENRLVITK